MLPSFWQLNRLHWPLQSRQIPIRIRARIYLRLLTAIAILTRTRVDIRVDRGGGIALTRVHHFLEGGTRTTLVPRLPLRVEGDILTTLVPHLHLLDEGGTLMTLVRLRPLPVEGSTLMNPDRLHRRRVEGSTRMSLVLRLHLVGGDTRTTLVPHLHPPDDDDPVRVQK